MKCLPHFEKMALSQFKVYIEAGKTTQCIVCNNCNMSIFIPSSNVKEGVLCILQMLKIHTGLRKWTKDDRFHILLKKMNPLGIDRPCLKIEKDEFLFEKYRIASLSRLRAILYFSNNNSSFAILRHGRSIPNELIFLRRIWNQSCLVHLHRPVLIFNICKI